MLRSAFGSSVKLGLGIAALLELPPEDPPPHAASARVAAARVARAAALVVRAVRTDMGFLFLVG